MCLLTTLASYTINPPSLNNELPLDAFFRFGFPFLSKVTLAVLLFAAFFLLLSLEDGAMLLLPFIKLGLMTAGI